MNQSYHATLLGDRLEWIDPPPALDGPTLVEITILRPAETEEERRARGRRMAAALKRAADAAEAFAEITDPVLGQRQLRRDRPLPGRDG
jgi:hypothetical protein